MNCLHAIKCAMSSRKCHWHTAETTNYDFSLYKKIGSVFSFFGIVHSGTLCKCRFWFEKLVTFAYLVYNTVANQLFRNTERVRRDQTGDCSFGPELRLHCTQHSQQASPHSAPKSLQTPLK